MEQLLDIFRREMVTIEVLKEMSHDDLKSIGVKIFGQRHKILKELQNYKPQMNIVENIMATEESFEYP